MLLADGCPNTVEDLRVYESGILDVAAAERIDLKTKLGLAAEEISEAVLDFLLDEGRALDPLAESRRSVGVSDVVVTRQLKRWHAIHTIALVYRDGLHNQLNGRYGQQFDHYWELGRMARLQTVRFGIGVVLNPVPRAETPQITSVAGASDAATYYVQVTWLGASGQEGQPSILTAYEAAAGTVPVVGAVNPPAGVTGFNVYVGLEVGALTRQNASPVPVGGSLTVSALVSGAEPGDGQAADVYVTGARVLRRG